eukprot:TRINITY_DN9031_c0_g1_i1.p1 TRINITY_DN9031_c0_g1~~TRINITY_DN9031_c0_g1_i1.p1  ORF type:complete len:317 (-),score=106.11 TRINITY_DN9031_c0_g1_i1:194-1111(-)
MLNSGASGFQNAPISKMGMILVGGTSVLVSMTKQKNLFEFPKIGNIFEFWRLFSSHFPFGSASEILFGMLLIYYFRVFERQMGSRKFAAFLLGSISIFSMLQLALLVTFPKIQLPSGPYSYIFSLLTLYITEIPATYKFKIFFLPTSDKLFVYILALQLLFSNFPTSLLSGLFGVISGSIYRSKTLRLSKFQIPKSIVGFCSTHFLPLLQNPKAPQRRPVAIQPNGGSNQPAQRPRVAHHRNQVGQQLQEDVEWIPQPGPPPSDEDVALLLSMGFSQDQINIALRRTNNNLQLATNLLMEASGMY